MSLHKATRKILDLVIFLATGALCLATAYWLIHDDFVWIYGACFVYTAIATWRLSTSWLKKTFLFLSALLLSLALAEGMLSLAESAEQESERKSGSYTKGYSRPLRKNGGVLGYQPYAARQIQAWKTFGRERVYDVVYTIDGDGYRQTPGFTGEEEAGEPIVFFGGSFAFGEGVNDDETLPYFVAVETNWSRPVLNAAFIGYGPHQMLRSLELGTLGELGYGSVGIAVYEALPDHARRAAGDAWWDPVGPKYTLDETGAAQYRGRFTDVPTRSSSHTTDLCKSSRSPVAVVRWTGPQTFSLGRKRAIQAQMYI